MRTISGAKKFFLNIREKNLPQEFFFRHEKKKSCGKKNCFFTINKKFPWPLKTFLGERIRDKCKSRTKIYRRYGIGKKKKGGGGVGRI